MSRIIFAGIAAAMTVLLFTAPLPAQSATAPKAVSQTEQISLLQGQSEEAYAAGKWVAFFISNM
jgi:hypothetical protein